MSCELYSQVSSAFMSFLAFATSKIVLTSAFTIFGQMKENQLQYFQ